MKISRIFSEETEKNTDPGSNQTSQIFATKQCQGKDQKNLQKNQDKQMAEQSCVHQFLPGGLLFEALAKLPITATEVSGLTSGCWSSNNMKL
jgi:hypothetical protein